MLENTEPVSAFAIYSQIYKGNSETNTNKRKNKRDNNKAKKQKITHEKYSGKQVVNELNNTRKKNRHTKKNVASTTTNNIKIKATNKPKKNKIHATKQTQSENLAEKIISQITKKTKQNQAGVSLIDVLNSPPQKNTNHNKLETIIPSTKAETKRNGVPKSPKDISPIPQTTVQKDETKRTPKVVKKLRAAKPNLQKCSSGYFYVDNFDSVKTGEQMFSWIMHPIEIKQFFKENWEKQPIIIRRQCPQYFSNILTCEEIDRALRKQPLYFTKNIDITSYTASTGLRETHNPPGRATAPLVWDFYANGCSVRILNPQTFFPKVHALNAALQEYFGCFVGANVYLTPADSQGFAPHYDDIEAFVMQLEGEKLWRLYAPRNPAEVLPRFSSGNFTDSDLGEPIQEVLLKQGDVMYFPRGFIHQGVALGTTHSLHITLSVYQKNSWADLLEILLPAALKSAIEEDVSFRKGLPLNFLSNLGLVHSDKTSETRAEFMETLQNLMTKLVDYAPVDAAVDQIGKKFIHDSLPPFLREEEKETTVYDDGERIKNGEIHNQAEMCLATRVKLIRYNCIRMLREEDTIRIYHSVSNSKEYHEEEAQFLEIDEDLAPAVDALINSYPEYISVEDLPIEDDIEKVQIATDLWECGILKTEEPLSYESE